MTGEPIRVLVVDDQLLIRESIAALLDIQPGITVVGTAGDGREAIDGRSSPARTSSSWTSGCPPWTALRR